MICLSLELHKLPLRTVCSVGCRVSINYLLVVRLLTELIYSLGSSGVSIAFFELDKCLNMKSLAESFGY